MQHRSVIVVVTSIQTHWCLTMLKLTTKGHSLIMMMQHVSQYHCLCCQFINHVCMHLTYNYQCTWHDRYVYVCQACITPDGPTCNGQLHRAVQTCCHKWYTEYNNVCMHLPIYINAPDMNRIRNSNSSGETFVRGTAKHPGVYIVAEWSPSWTDAYMHI